MKVRYSKPKGCRIKKANYKDTYYRPFMVEAIGYWYCIDTNSFHTDGEIFGEDGLLKKKKYRVTSSCYWQDNGVKLRSLKAVKRFIAKSNLPKGTWFIAILPYVGHSMRIRK